MSHCRIWLGLILALSTAAPLAAADENRPADKVALPAAVDTLFRWLPVDTETVIVSRGLVELPQPRGDDAKAPSLGEVVSGIPAGLPALMHKGLLAEKLRGHRFRVAIEGSRRYRAPQALGLMPFEGCQILQFFDVSEKTLAKAFSECLEQAASRIELAGTQIALFNERWESDDWTIYIAHPQRGVLLCATDRAYLEEVPRRMAGKPEDRALPETLPEWKHVNVKAPVWGVRHYRKEHADDDPSSPVGRHTAANIPDPKAVGFAFWYDPDAEKPLMARYLSGANDPAQIVTRGWVQPDEQFTPEVHGIAGDAVEISWKSKDGTGDFMALFVLLIYLGHGVFV